jgi:hypothetical protein
MMRFAYSSYHAERTAADSIVDPSPSGRYVLIHRPDLKVRVCGPGRHPKEIPLWGLVDIGAVECILPREIAEQVNASLLGTGSIGDYAGGEHDVDYGQVYLQVRLGKERLRWPAIVAFSSKRTGAALWGRRGFLDYFTVCFNGPERHFTIRRRGVLPTGFRAVRMPTPEPRGRGVKGSDLITPVEQNP